MQMMYLTIAGLLLYLVSDWILQRVEIHYGKRFEYRNLFFFLILVSLSLISFALIRVLQPG